MTDPETLRALADRALASGPDRVLDAQIAMALHVDQDLVDVLPDAHEIEEIEGGWAKMIVPAYTASLDAAMGLVPDGWFLTLDRYLISDEPGVWGSWRVWLKNITSQDEVVKVFARATTPALALCAVSLRSHATMQEASDGA